MSHFVDVFHLVFKVRYTTLYFYICLCRRVSPCIYYLLVLVLLTAFIVKYCISHRVEHGYFTFIVCLRWRLHFEFVTSCEPLPGSERPSNPEDSASWRGPATINVETMVWDLPVKIYPTSPLHASSVTSIKTGSCVHI